MDCPPKNGLCREVAVSEGSTVYFFLLCVRDISLFWLGTQAK